MYNLVDLTGKKIVVTGASSGIGRQIAITISKLGGEVIGVARREEQLKDTIALLEGKGHYYYVHDLSECEKIEDLFRIIKTDVGCVDGLAYAAGIVKDAPLNLVSPSKMQETFNVNFFAFTECARQICKKGRFNAGTSIVAISSVASCVGEKGQVAYAASKAAMNGAIRCIAKEVMTKNIRVNAVVPGMIDTNIYQEYLNSMIENESDIENGLRKRQYLGVGKTEDVANLVVFLLSSASRFITGSCIPIDGGFTSN